MADLGAAVTKLGIEMAQVSKQVFARGLTSAISGNLSARLPGCQQQVLIKSSGRCLGEAKPEDFILVDLEGNILAGTGQPSIEMGFHLGIYKIRSDVQAIIHGHSPYATAYATAKGKLPPVTVAAEKDLDRVAVIEYAAPGSKRLAALVTAAFKDETMRAVVLKGHGFITVGRSIHQAYYLADSLEGNAQVAFLLSQLSKG